jgi:hypothetical protein
LQVEKMVTKRLEEKERILEEAAAEERKRKEEEEREKEREREVSAENERKAREEAEKARESGSKKGGGGSVLNVDVSPEDEIVSEDDLERCAKISRLKTLDHRP